MGWLRKKKPKSERAEGEAKFEIAERGAMLLKDLIECCNGKSNPIKFFSAMPCTDNFSFEMRWWRKKKPKFERAARGAMLLEDLLECCDGKSNPIKLFSAHQIRKATNNFSESNYVSELSDSDNKWYSGKNENHPMILIRKPVGIFYVYTNFCRDITISSMVSGHKNFLKLVGCCLDFECPLLVYHGVKKHYQLDISEQPWKRRMKIAEDIATSLAYLHTAFPRPFIYRNMSSKKISLDEDGVAKLSDFYNVVSIPKGETFVQVDRRAGGFGYMDYDEKNGVVSEKTDVFAIGMLMQTLLTGKESLGWFWVAGFDFDENDNRHHIFEMEGQGRSITNWQSNFMEEGIMDEIADPMLGEISEEELCQMKAFRKLSQRCIGEGEVPTMVEVAKELKKIQRSLRQDSSSPQDISSSSSQTRFKTQKALLTSNA